MMFVNVGILQQNTIGLKINVKEKIGTMKKEFTSFANAKNSHQKMKLKTLKDLYEQALPKELIGKSHGEIFDFFIRELKAEAIKWVKYYQKKKFIDDENAQWLRMWIVKFFNLTEEDLK